MRDGKALQMATSHELGQNFAKAFEMKYLGDDSQEHYCFTTSWGASTRLVGGLVMAHGDDRGLVIPPRLAAIQAVVICIKDDDQVMSAANTFKDELSAQGISVEIDRKNGSLGRRITDWEIKGVPLRLEIGLRDLAEGVVTVVRRDNGEKVSVPLGQVTSHVARELDALQSSLFESALTRRDKNTHDVNTLDQAIEAAQTGFARMKWSKVQDTGEATLNASQISVRCLQRPDGTLPQDQNEDDLICIVAKAY